MSQNQTHFNLTPIGIINTPFDTVEGMPIQPLGAKLISGSVEIYQPYVEGLSDIEGFSHLFLLYLFHKCKGFKLQVKPFLDTCYRGVFATRAPQRPNAIGLSVVKLLNREDHILQVQGIDVVDGTPLVDIKPYVPEFDSPEVEKIGWLEKKVEKAHQMMSDDRFTSQK